MENKSNSSKSPVRRYPALYERLVPVAIGLIVMVLLVLLFITFGVALGFLARPV